MHFLFPFLIGSKIDDSYRSHKLLSGEEQPEFLRPDYSLVISMNNQLFTFKSAIVESSKREYVYYKCDVTITSESKFLNNYGFGKSTSSGFGGALYMYESVFQIVSPDPSKNSIFSGNSAAYGGALCLVSTASYLSNAVFTSNQAYKHAGAVYFENKLISNGRLSNVV
ncbi:hypothetical protein TVAG_438320 [Trichomonas vaginalis G3]|uniref:Polymorphic outer membrane protein n=1 Tax=Trichomonas vaginalis (strain ATCC PRA-98 / G3) TaxID=412133 RepID=A2EYM8_TRIV3|nr:hypothetical protein TVAGG3_0672330 [Trichomonas vaginalis G3]EAY02241.1 hypothetical protein TVAG_438320 [Trichomonas vaginalis G3]KAI5507288.1 hypothetical protein TVAGG3_0672330 [Trichomonas vaginalis G3]|eukprot:XP_001330600.1 hypothetical protein [Trichomonas vaginalis G3]